MSHEINVYDSISWKIYKIEVRWLKTARNPTKWSQIQVGKLAATLVETNASCVHN